MNDQQLLGKTIAMQINVHMVFRPHNWRCQRKSAEKTFAWMADADYLVLFLMRNQKKNGCNLWLCGFVSSWIRQTFLVVLLNDDYRGVTNEYSLVLEIMQMRTIFEYCHLISKNDDGMWYAIFGNKIIHAMDMQIANESISCATLFPGLHW